MRITRALGHRTAATPLGRVLLTVLAAAAVATLATLLLGPKPPTLSPAASGDPELAGEVRALLGDGAGYRGVAVALVDDGGVRFAGLGSSGDDERPAVDEHTRFEIGSIIKTLNGMLLADLVSSGEVSLDQRVGDLVPGTALERTGDATLAELATHRSGLPRLPQQPRFVARAAVTNLTGGDPYRNISAQDVLSWAGEAAPSGGADPEYSNFGAAVLGHALATQQDTPYPDLLTNRILRPLTMTQTVVAVDSATLPDPRASGSAQSGRAQAPWISTGFMPAGSGIWSTTGDLARLARAVLDGTAPGVSAVQPRWDFAGGDRIGLGWITSDVEGRTITWHNGGTGGFRSFIGLDAEAGRAVVVLSNTTAPIDGAARELLIGPRP